MSDKNNVISVAKKYLENGYSVIPVNKNKNPAVSSWGQYVYSPVSLSFLQEVFSGAWGIALLTGGNKNLTAIDVDLKYDLSGDLWDRLKLEIGGKLLKKLCCNKTVSGGYHLIFSCTKIQGNEKLANRETTDEERHQTYMTTFAETGDIEVSFRSGLADTSRVLIETRGQGGYVLIPPSPGYTPIYGKIQEITEEEYDHLMEICRSFNTYIKPVKNYVAAKMQRDKGVDVFYTFNKNADVITLLEQYGWSQVGSDSGRIKLKRPGNVASKHSAYFDESTRLFWVFTTSTSFTPGQGYSAVDVLLELKYGGDSTRLNELYSDIKDVIE